MVSQILVSLSLQCLYDLWKRDLQCVDGKLAYRETRGHPAVAQ